MVSHMGLSKDEVHTPNPPVSAIIFHSWHSRSRCIPPMFVEATCLLSFFGIWVCIYIYIDINILWISPYNITIPLLMDVGKTMACLPAMGMVCFPGGWASACRFAAAWVVSAGSSWCGSHPPSTPFSCFSWPGCGSEGSGWWFFGHLFSLTGIGSDRDSIS